ncbi:hypothetical protein NPIL_449411 [Nephila pilipes]|uniref:Uncharacterized protein n=1 Tax=Nephila pilipes TaxID=299642 RepID=A0A8X6Q821_NEPPI|nr:hypothetical protein NPIL_449411 [Nephila pilipes]
MYNNRRRLAQWLDRDEAPKQFSNPILHQKKIIVTDWCSGNVINDYNFSKLGKTITSKMYCKEIDKNVPKTSKFMPSIDRSKRANSSPSQS